MKHTLVLAAALACASPTYAQDSAFFTTSDGVRIHYLTMGNSGSWVVLIHGYTDTAQRMWFTTGIAPVLAKRHRVVALDNRNHGQSDKPVPNGPGRAQDIASRTDIPKPSNSLVDSSKPAPRRWSATSGSSPTKRT